MLRYIRLLDGSRIHGRMRLFFLLCALCCVSPVFAAPEPVGKAETVRGVVTIEREGRSIVAKAGESVYLRDKLQTKSDSGVEIVFLDESRVKMASNSVLEITEFVYDPREKTRQGLLSMASGKARFMVQDLQDFKDKRFRVQTQTAIVGTRDTDFIVGVRREEDMPRNSKCKGGAVEAFCLENAVAFTSLGFPDKPVILTANMISLVCGRELPTPPRFALPEERRGLLKELETIGVKTTPGRPELEKKEGKGEGESTEAPPGGLGENITGPMHDRVTMPAQEEPTSPYIITTSTTTTTTTLPRHERQPLPPPPPPPGMQ